MNALLLSPNGILYEGEAESIYVPSVRGPLGILEGYTSVIEALAEEGVASIKTPSGERFFAIRHGVLEVRPDRVMVLANDAKEAEDAAEAKKLLKAWKS